MLHTDQGNGIVLQFFWLTLPVHFVERSNLWLAGFQAGYIEEEQPSLEEIKVVLGSLLPLTNAVFSEFP